MYARGRAIRNWVSGGGTTACRADDGAQVLIHDAVLVHKQSSAGHVTPVFCVTNYCRCIAFTIHLENTRLSWNNVLVVYNNTVKRDDIVSLAESCQYYYNTQHSVMFCINTQLVWWILMMLPAPSMPS